MLLAVPPVTTATPLLIGPPALTPLVPEVIGPIAVVQRLNNLLQQGLAVARAISSPGSGLRSGLSAVLQHVRDLVGHSGNDSQENPGGPKPPVPAPVPASLPVPTPLPSAPAEQGGGGSGGNGSSVSSSSHGHGKGGNASAVLGGALLILFLRPLGMSRRLQFSGYSRSLQPLALPG